MQQPSTFPGEPRRAKASPDLLEAVAAALPPPDSNAIPARDVHERVGAWNRTTIRHALRELVRSGRATFVGGDRHRKYRLTGPLGSQRVTGKSAEPARPASLPTRGNADTWRDYALRGDGSVLLPDPKVLAETMEKHGVRYGDVDLAELQREERLAGWARRPPTGAALTRAVFGDPQPGRRKPPRPA